MSGLAKQVSESLEFLNEGLAGILIKILPFFPLALAALSKSLEYGLDIYCTNQRSQFIKLG